MTKPYIEMTTNILSSMAGDRRLHVIEACFLLLCPDFTVNWSLILLSSVELFLISENKIYRKSRELAMKCF